MKNQIHAIKNFKEILLECNDLRKKKRKDYANAWKILRPSSSTDQIFIKAQRIRSVQEKKESKVKDSLDNEFTGIINYSIMALYGITDGINSNRDLAEFKSTPEIDKKDDQEFEKIISGIEKLFDQKKEELQRFRISSLSDLILMKALRVKDLEDSRLNAQEIQREITEAYKYMIICSVFSKMLITQGVDPMI